MSLVCFSGVAMPGIAEDPEQFTYVGDLRQAVQFLVREFGGD